MKKRMLCALFALCLLIGYMPVPNTANAETFTAYIVDAVLRIYELPSTSARYKTYYFGASFPCDQIQGDWARLKNGSYTGYCAASGISRENPNKYNTKMYVNANGVKVYEQPVTDARVMMTVNKNDSYTKVAVTRDGEWTRLKNGTYYGYVQSKYLSTSPVSDQNRVYIIENLLNIYKSNSETSAVLNVAAYGESYVGDAAQGGWCRIAYSGGYGFCKSDALSLTDPNTLTNTVYINANGVKVYQKPDTDAHVMMTVAKDSSYTARAVTPDGMWYRLQNGTHFGYVESKYVTHASGGDLPTGSAYPIYITANTLNAYAAADTSAAVLGVMSFGEKFICNNITGQWARILNDGKVGYCKITGISAQDPNTINRDIYINADNVPVYRKATENSGVMMHLVKNSCYVARGLTKDGEWTRLQNGKYFGYVQSKYIAAAPTADSQTVYITANTLPAYAAPSVRGTVLGIMSYGESMIQLAVQGDWARIQNGAGRIGYCRTAGLSAENPNIYAQTVYVNRSGAMLYTKPSYAYGKKAARVNEAFHAVAITKDNAWVRLTDGNTYLYIESKFLGDMPQDPAISDTVYVRDNTMPVYAAASEQSALLGVMSYAEQLTMQEVQDGWARVVNGDGKTGYCRYGSLDKVNPNTYNVAMYVLNANTAIRKKPTANADILKKAARGAQYTVVAITGDREWVRVDMGGGSYGYARSADMSADKPSEDTAAIRPVDPFTVYVQENLAGCYASSDVNAKVLGMMAYGEAYTCIGFGDGWAKLRYGSGVEGYCQIGALTVNNPNTTARTMYAQMAGVTVYAKPSESASVLGTLQVNAAVNVIAVTPDGEWLRMQNGSATGYAEAKRFAKTKVNTGVSGKAAAVVELAQKQMGKPYVYAAKGPNKFDCSGLTCYVFKNAVNITLPRTAYAQGYNDKYPKISSISDLQIGDLVFFDTSSDSDLCDHAGIFIGGGQFIHASSAGGKVMISSLRNNSYYARTFSWGRRVL